MHLFDKSVNFLGGPRIVGAHLPSRGGGRLRDQVPGRRPGGVCYFGDGAVPEGEFHESMNLAALWKLPVIFICENNRYRDGHRDPSRAGPDRHLALRGDVRHSRRGGRRMDVAGGAGHGAASAVERARRDKDPHAGGGAHLSLRGHSMPTRPGSGDRTKEEVEREKLRDPITLFSDRCLKEGVRPRPTSEHREGGQRPGRRGGGVREASPEPPPESCFTHVYKD